MRRYKEMQTVPAEQLSAFLEEAKRSGVYEMYYIELATGFRRGELLGLKWQDIDWKNGIMKVRRQVARVDSQIVEAPLKTKNSYRAVSISPQAIEVLREQKHKTNDAYVFPSPNGGPISPDSVNNMLKRILERAGIPKVRFHDLRHTFSSCCGARQKLRLSKQARFLPTAATRSPRSSRHRRRSDRSPSPSRTVWVSRLCPACWVTSPQASPWTPMPMSPPRHKRKRLRLWGMSSRANLYNT